MAIPDHLSLLAARIEVPDHEECGPHMRALNENQRRYVCALGVFGNNLTVAYQWAFGVEKKNVAQVNSSRLGSTQKIKDAIHEFYQSRLHVLGPALAAERILEALSFTNTDLKIAMKAVEVASNVIPGFKAATAIEMTVKHEYSLVDLEKRRGELEHELGIVSALPNPNIIEAEFEVVIVDCDGIEDLL